MSSHYVPKMLTLEYATGIEHLYSFETQWEMQCLLYVTTTDSLRGKVKNHTKRMQ
jgi:hypothetical protein